MSLKQALSCTFCLGIYFSARLGSSNPSFRLCQDVSAAENSGEDKRVLCNPLIQLTFWPTEQLAGMQGREEPECLLSGTSRHTQWRQGMNPFNSTLMAKLHKSIPSGWPELGTSIPASAGTISVRGYQEQPARGATRNISHGLATTE